MSASIESGPSVTPAQRRRDSAALAIDHIEVDERRSASSSWVPRSSGMFLQPVPIN
jgi:hypothetical protein